VSFNKSLACNGSLKSLHDAHGHGTYIRSSIDER